MLRLPGCNPPAWVLSPVSMSFPLSETVQVLAVEEWERVWG